MSGGVGIVVIIFGVVWTVIAGALFPPMAIFGVLWTFIAIIITVYNFKNAKSKNRYSEFDIVDSDAETDPLNERFGGDKPERKHDGGFCPYCGEKAERDHAFCAKCGKRLK